MAMDNKRDNMTLIEEAKEELKKESEEKFKRKVKTLLKDIEIGENDLQYFDAKIADMITKKKIQDEIDMVRTDKQFAESRLNQKKKDLEDLKNASIYE